MAPPHAARPAKGLLTLNPPSESLVFNAYLTDVKLATRLASWGRRNDHPGALVLASQILSAATPPADLRKSATLHFKHATTAPGSTSGHRLLREADAWLKAHGKGHDALRALQHQLSQYGVHSQGAVGTSGCPELALPARGQVDFSAVFEAHKDAAVIAWTHDGSPLSCEIRGPSERLLQRDRGGATCALYFNPRQAARLQIQLTHRGRKATHSTICVH